MRFRFLPVILFGFIILFFFNSFIIQGKLPIPSDTIVGLYHPFRDLYSKDYPNGIPFKNSLITDPVRQQYPWRDLAISLEKKFELPLWNPYNLSGIPLLANMQSAVLYPLNLLFFIFPFSIAWSFLIVLGPLLGGVFIYFYLCNLKIKNYASLLGALSFSFSGFFVAWMEWGTILHVGLWLPLILLSIDKIFSYLATTKISNIKYQISNIHIKNKKLLAWGFVFVFSLVSSFFAGHLQIFFYIFILSALYFGTRWIQFGQSKKILFLFLILNSSFIILASVQWLPTLQFILHSARGVDQVDWQNPGWFIPWQHLIQFIAPDFFGNPTTLNYWGAWNYGEFVGYVGIAPLVMAIFALFFRHDKKTLIFGTIFFISLMFSFPTFLGKLPYILGIPFLSTAQPTRLLVITDFSLAVLAAFGFDYFVRIRKKEIFYPLTFAGFILGGIWIFVMFGNDLINVGLENLSVARKNLVLPTLIFITIAMLIVLIIVSDKKKFFIFILYCIIAVTVFDLLRFGFKFNPFTNKDYLFPETKTTSFLQEQKGQFRIMATDRRIFPPNFSTYYRLQSVDGYDPLYLARYGELIAASERGEPNISPPFGFNRIITPHNFNSKIIDLLGVKYILSLSDIDSQELKKVFQEGETRVYENKNVLPRAFFVEDVKLARSKDEAIKMMFEEKYSPLEMAIVEDPSGFLSNSPQRRTKGEVEIIRYSENKISIKTENRGDGFMVLVDSFYPAWRASIDNEPTIIYRTDYNFRGISVPKGDHHIEFYTTLL